MSPLFSLVPAAPRFAAALAVLTAFSVLPTEADAQYGYRRGFGGVRVSAPGVGVSVGRFGGVRVATPGVAVGVPGGYYGRRYFPPRPRVVGGYYYSGPGVVVSGGTTVVSPTPATATPTPAVEGSTTVTTTAKPTLAASVSFATEAELAAMGGVELLAATSEASAALQARLESFQNGAGWQEYLAFEAETAGNLDAAEKLLRRFDSVARDAQFAMIARLEEFKALRTALRVLVDRGGVAISTEAGVPATPPNVSVKVKSEGIPAPTADDYSTPAGSVPATGVPATGGPTTGAGVDVGVSAGGVRVKVERSVLTNRP